jgi:hypothetical protein
VWLAADWRLLSAIVPMIHPTVQEISPGWF